MHSLPTNFAIVLHLAGDSTIITRPLPSRISMPSEACSPTAAGALGGGCCCCSVRRSMRASLRPLTGSPRRASSSFSCTTVKRESSLALADDIEVVAFRLAAAMIGELRSRHETELRNPWNTVLDTADANEILINPADSKGKGKGGASDIGA